MANRTCLLLIGVILTLILLCSIALAVWQVILEIQCLDLNLPNVNCTYTNHNHTTAVGIMEPLLSVALVVLVFWFYFVGCSSSTKDIAKVLRQNWCVKRIVPTLLAIVHYALVYAGNLASFDTGPYRYISLTFGVTSWLVLLTLSNENGSLSCVWKKAQKSEEEGGGSAKGKNLMKALSFALFLFACLTNLLEFIVFTVYITKTMTPLNVPTEHKHVLNAFDFLGMTVVIALRLDFASFFGDMAILSLKDVEYKNQVKFLQDPWDERGNNSNMTSDNDDKSPSNVLPRLRQGREPENGSSTGATERTPLLGEESPRSTSSDSITSFFKSLCPSGGRRNTTKNRPA